MTANVSRALRTATVISILCLPVFAARPAAGQPVVVDDWRTNAFQAEIIVHGSPAPTYRHGGQTYVEGRIGEHYGIRVHNRSPRRIEAVVAVDGRDVVDGQPSSLHKRGYVVAPYSFTDIDGFRLSLESVAAFRFTSVPDSYASRMGTPWRAGSIDVSVFPERLPPRPAPPVYRGPRGEGRSEAAPGRSRSSRDQGLGTEFGERQSSAVVETSFIRANHSVPAWRMSVRYDDRVGLCRKGLSYLCERRPVQPVPYESYGYWLPERRFAKPPPGWRGW